MPDVFEKRKDPATTSPGYEDYQWIGRPQFKITLNRDHIIPYEKIITFLVKILSKDDLKKNEWIESALNKYQFNQTREKEYIFSNASKIIKDVNTLKSILHPKEDEDLNKKFYNKYKSIFEKKRIGLNAEIDDQIKALLEFYFTTNDIYKKKLKSLIDELNNKIRSQGLEKQKYLPSDFFTNDEGIYINVDIVKKNHENRDLTDNDKIIIQRATGWMPGNVFLAPKPKPQDQGNEFDCTVAATDISTLQPANYKKAYDNINLFLDNEQNDVAQNAIKVLTIIASSRANLWPFIYTNWAYDSKGFYPNKIFDFTHNCIIDNTEFKSNPKTLITEEWIRKNKDKLKKQ